MKLLSWIIGGLALVLAVVGVFFILHRPTAQAPSTSNSGNAAVGANGNTLVITYSDTGFSPTSVTISPGTTVTWSNASSHPLQIEGNGIHQESEITEGGSYSATLTTPGSISYRNVSRTSDTGSVVVTDPSLQPQFNANSEVQ